MGPDSRRIAEDIAVSYVEAVQRRRWPHAARGHRRVSGGPKGEGGFGGPCCVSPPQRSFRYDSSSFFGLRELGRSTFHVTILSKGIPQQVRQLTSVLNVTLHTTTVSRGCDAIERIVVGAVLAY